MILNHPFRRQLMLSEYAESRKKIGDFSRHCQAMMKCGKTFAPIHEAEFNVSKHLNYENYFDRLRSGKYGVIVFDHKINDARFASTIPLKAGGRYRAKIFMNTKWASTQEIVAFCKAEKDAILAGPHGLAAAIEHVDKLLPLCKLLVSLDPNDVHASRVTQILSAGKCSTGSWEFSVHNGDWAPGMFFILFFNV